MALQLLSNFSLRTPDLFNFERDAYRTTADLFGQPLTYFPDKFVVTVTSDGSRYQLDKSKAPSNKLTPTDTLSDAERRACWLPLPTVADKSKMANMVTSTGLSGGTITIAAGDGKAVKSLANGNKGQILKIGTDGLKWADEKTYSADNGLTLNPSTNTFSLNAAGENVFGGVKLNKGGLWIDDETDALSIKASNNSGLNIDLSGELSVKTGSGLTISNTDGSVELSKSLTGMTLTNTTLTGITTTPTPNGNQGNEVTNVTYVDTKIESAVGGLSKALVFIGEVSGGITPSNAKVGYVYVVTDNGTYAGQKCEPGDTLICKKNGIQTSDGWIVVEKNIDGAVTASSELTNGAIVVGSGGTKVHTIATPSTQGLVLQTTGSGFGWKEPAKYQLTAAAKGKMGGVSIGDGIKVTSDGTISLSGGTGISITSDTISNTGVISVTSGTSANQISVTKGGKDSIITINNVENASTVNGHTVEKNVPSGAKFTDDSVTQRTYNSHGIPDVYERPLLIGSSIIEDGTVSTITGDTFVSPRITASIHSGSITATGGFIGNATSASKLSVNGGNTSTNGVLVIGNYSAGTTINGNAIPGNFTATDFITSDKYDEPIIGELTIYDMNVRLAEVAISASSVGFPLIIKPLNDNGKLDENVDGKNWIEYDGSVKGEGLDAITWGEIDNLFNATPTV